VKVNGSNKNKQRGGNYGAGAGGSRVMRGEKKIPAVAGTHY